MDFAIADLEKNKKALAEKQALFLSLRYENMKDALYGKLSSIFPTNEKWNR